MSEANFYSQVGNNIRTYRKLQHMTQQDLATRINKSMACVSKYEKGDISIDLYTIYEIADVLNIPPFLLLPQKAGNQSEVSMLPMDLPPLFQHTPLYLYTWSTAKAEMVCSVIELHPERMEATAYYGVDDLSNYRGSAYIMLGTIARSDLNIQMYFSNPLLKGDFMLICFRTADIIAGHCQGFFGALNNRQRFCASKCYLSDVPVRNTEALKVQLSIEKDEISYLRKNNVLFL